MPVVCLVAVISLAGCSVFRKTPPDVSRDHAFISYWPQAVNGQGLRLAVKDIIDVRGTVTTAGSEYLAKNSPPARRDAACMAIARKRNVRLVGKTNTTELAVGVSGINEYFRTPRNPLSWRRRLIPGGSSSGSAVAVATGKADVAFGTDTAGSIRVPAACCGVVGLKTTFGLVPLDGIYPIAPQDLDTVGPMAKDVAGVVRGMDLLQEGFTARYRRAVVANPGAARIRVGRLHVPGTKPEVDRAIDRALAATGFEVVTLDRAFTDSWEQAQKDTTTIAAANAWLYNRRFETKLGIAVRTKASFAVGRAQLPLLRKALRQKRRWQAVVTRAFEKVDFIAMPTLKTLPPSLPLFGGTPLFEALILSRQNTAPANLAGVPALAIPVPVRDWAVPVTSLQLIGPEGSEAELLNAGRMVEETMNAPKPQGAWALRWRKG